MKPLLIDPSQIKVFGTSTNSHFCLVTNPSLSEHFEILKKGNYLSYQIIIHDTSKSFEKLLTEDVPDNANVLVISPDVYFRSPSQELIGPGRKLLALACNSTPTDLETIRHFIQIINDTDPIQQQAMADRFFELGGEAKYLDFIDETNQTSARFTLHERYLWNEQAGILNVGEQQIAPAGEISVLPIQILDFDETLRLDFDGTIAFNGTSILHGGRSPHFSRSDQQRLHAVLNGTEADAIIAEIKDGVIGKMHPKSHKSKAACDLLQSMFDIDSRYRILWEIGFGINTSHKILPGNHAMNETYGGTDGSIHFGLGLTPWTQYHLDILCPKISVVTDKGDYLINRKQMKLNRQKSSGCGCVEA